MKAKEIIIYSFLLIAHFLSGCFEGIFIDEKERETNLAIINSSEHIPGIKFQLSSKIDTVRLYKEFLNFWTPKKRKAELYNTLELKHSIEKYSSNKNEETFKTYYFNEDSLAIITNSNKNNTYSLIKPKKDSIFFYWTNKDGRFFRNRQLDIATINFDSLVEFKIDTFRQDRKYILGFDCFKVKVTVPRYYNRLSKEKVISYYDCYITDEISNFPCYLHFSSNSISSRPFPKLNGCALEIIQTESILPHHSTTISALEVSQNAVSVFDIPDSLKNAERYYHTKHNKRFDEATSQWLDSLECHGKY